MVVFMLASWLVCANEGTFHSWFDGFFFTLNKFWISNDTDNFVNAHSRLLTNCIPENVVEGNHEMIQISV